jgi:type III secretion protein D
LHASLEGDRIVVHGLVRSNADAIAVKEMLQKIAPSNSLVDISNVADVIANIQDSVHDAAVKVGYEGDGKFNVTGAVRSVAAMQKTVAQIEVDFGSSIKISLNVTPAAQKWDVADSESALVSGSLQYVQAVDGSKHFPPSRY